jgi:hypothetical protein
MLGGEKVENFRPKAVGELVVEYLADDLNPGRAVLNRIPNSGYLTCNVG